jgi:hypothetical protein
VERAGAKVKSVVPGKVAFFLDNDAIDKADSENEVETVR